MAHGTVELFLLPNAVDGVLAAYRTERFKLAAVALGVVPVGRAIRGDGPARRPTPDHNDAGRQPRTYSRPPHSLLVSCELMARVHNA